MNIHDDFVYVNSDFEKKFSANLSARWVTYKIALNLLVQMHPDRPINILETGCQRMVDDWGGGCSTWVFADFLTQYGLPDSTLVSIDLEPANMALAEKVLAEKFTQPYGFEFIPWVNDSLEALSRLVDKEEFSVPYAYDFIYLDSMDCDPRVPEGEFQTVASQQHQLQEYYRARMLFRPGNPFHLLMLDDNNLPWGGKCTLTKAALKRDGWVCIFDYQQSLWVKS